MYNMGTAIGIHGGAHQSRFHMAIRCMTTIMARSTPCLTMLWMYCMHVILYE
jgi:hypothetical protein